MNKVYVFNYYFFWGFVYQKPGYRFNEYVSESMLRANSWNEKVKIDIDVVLVGLFLNILLHLFTFVTFNKVIFIKVWNHLAHPGEHGPQLLQGQGARPNGWGETNFFPLWCWGLQIMTSSVYLRIKIFFLRRIQMVGNPPESLQSPN